MSAIKEYPFQTAYGSHKSYHVPTGDGTEPTYEYVVKESGAKVLEQTGTKDVYSEIQAQAEECKIENILRRVAVGDMTDFRPDGIYADATVVPNNMVEAMQQIQKMHTIWDKLPADVRKEYNNDLDQFVADSGSEKWLDLMGIKPKMTDKIDTKETQVTKTTTTESN